MTRPDWWPDERAHAGREHFDPQHAARYDAKMDAGAEDEIRLLQATGALHEAATVVELGTGTGQFALAVAAHAARVVAVDVSPVMLARLREKAMPPNVEVVDGGFLSYDHAGEPADVVYSRFALHHLPDFWKAIALTRMAAMLRPGGTLRLSDVVYGFEPQQAQAAIEAWMQATAGPDWAREELVEHVRDESSTFTWLLEPMIERAGFAIDDAAYDDGGMLARYLCTRRS